jgi:hypothetical protein
MPDAIHTDLRQSDRHEWENPENWGGPDWIAIYFSKRDSRVWVPKRLPWMGWTLNLARDGGVFWLVGLLAGVPTLVVLLSILIFAASANGETFQASSFPPVVVETVPAAGDHAVDPSLREIRVTFSEDMLTKEMWSFVYANPAPFPKITGPIRYVGKRTCVMPVALEPGKSYGIWINSQNHDAFRDTTHQPAVPYLLTFKTRR